MDYLKVLAGILGIVGTLGMGMEWGNWVVAVAFLVLGAMGLKK